MEAISVNRFLNDFFHRISFNHKKYRSLFSIWNWYGQSCKIYRTISFLWKNNYALTTFHQRYLCSFNQSFHWHVHFHSLKFEREKPRIRRQSFVYGHYMPCLFWWPGWARNQGNITFPSNSRLLNVKTEKFCKCFRKGSLNI